MPKAMLGDYIDLVEGFPVVDLDTAGASADYINMKDVETLMVVFASGVGTAGQDPVLDFEQASDNSGTGNKALSLPTTSSTRVWKKQAATSLASTTQWTDGSGDVSTAALTNATGAEQSCLWAVEIFPSDLDVANAFDHVRVTIDDDMSNTQPGYLLYIIKPLYPSAPDSTVSYL